jgi:hypothetical protein
LKEDAIEEFDSLESNDTLELSYDNIVYYILQNASSSDGSLDCPFGTIPFIAYCGKLYSLYKRTLVVFIHLNVESNSSIASSNPWKQVSVPTEVNRNT